MIEKVLRVLLVEDDAADQVLVRNLLSSAGMPIEVTSAASMAEATHAAGNGMFDLVLLDVSLPDGQGLAMVMEAVVALAGLPVVVLTGLTDEEAGEGAVQAGAQDYLVKGRLTRETLGTCIRYALARHAVQQALRQTRDHLEERVRRGTADLAATVEDLQGEVRQRLLAEAGLRRAEREVLEATEREQQRIGRDLHDSVQGSLAGLGYMLEALKRGLAQNKTDPATLIAGLDDLSNVVADILKQTQGLVRGLCPLELKSDGLMRAFQQLASTISRLFRVDCQFRCEGAISIDDETVATQLYRICQEAIGNGLKHANARQIVIWLKREDKGLTLAIEDDGVGIPEAASRARGMGLRTMNYRARLVGATLAIRRGKKAGTVVECLLPHRALA
jgi:signal transduction histidine kinase